MGLRVCPETSVRNYHHPPLSSPYYRSSHLLPDEGLKLRTATFISLPLHLTVFTEIRQFVSYDVQLQSEGVFCVDIVHEDFVLIGFMFNLYI